MKESFAGIYRHKNRLWTKNLVRGQRVYGEKLLNKDKEEYREWNPYRSKLAAAIVKGLKQVPVKAGSRVLYLGIAEGTTASHLSDVIGSKGIIFGVDVSGRCIAKLMQSCEKRSNIIPFLGNASNPAEYADYCNEIKPQLIYQDISQKNQVEILKKNAVFLEEKGMAMLALKAPSISSTTSAEKVFSSQEKLIREEFEILQSLPLQPFEEKHRFYLLKKI